MCLICSLVHSWSCKRQLLRLCNCVAQSIAFCIDNSLYISHPNPISQFHHWHIRTTHIKYVSSTQRFQSLRFVYFKNYTLKAACICVLECFIFLCKHNRRIDSTSWMVSLRRHWSTLDVMLINDFIYVLLPSVILISIDSQAWSYPFRLRP